MEVISSNKTIAKNTLFLYGRMLFNLVVSLYTSRVILHVLGVSDLGVYQVVAGIVSLFTFLNGSLAGATSRFLAYELGRGDIMQIKRTFSSTLNVHIITAFLLFIVCEILGLWFINNKMNIPDGRVFAANIVFQCSLMMTVLSLIQAPYNATIIAHEKMNVFAYIGILDTLLKLLACYILYIITVDKLIVYGCLLLLFTVVINSSYFFYCKMNFRECVFTPHLDWKICKPILIFSGWELFGDFCLIAKNQGINILLNLFFGVAVNAACGFANTIYGAIAGFSNNFMISIRPAITKAYSIGDFGRMNMLINQSSKFAFALMLLLTTPFIFDSEYILVLWLKTPPNFTSVFCKFLLLTLNIAVLFSPIIYAVNATGKNKNITILHGPGLLLVLPLSFIALKISNQPYYPFAITFLVEVICFSCFPFILKRIVSQFDIWNYFRKIIFPCLCVAGAVYLITFFVFIGLDSQGLFHLFLISLSSTCSTIIFSFLFLLQKEEKLLFLSKIQRLKF